MKNKLKELNLDLFTIGVIVITAIAFIAIIFLGNSSNNKDSSSDFNEDIQKPAKVEIKEVQYDWGTIKINGGKVKKVFEIKNTSNNKLFLTNIKTSCMCTTAQIKTNEQVSKKFGMHERVSNKIEVAPGQTAEVIVEFDPAYHGPNGLGAIERIVSMNTNDPNNPTLNFRLSAQVVR